MNVHRMEGRIYWLNNNFVCFSYFVYLSTFRAKEMLESLTSIVVSSEKHNVVYTLKRLFSQFFDHYSYVTF